VLSEKTLHEQWKEYLKWNKIAPVEIQNPEAARSPSASKAPFLQAEALKSKNNILVILDEVHKQALSGGATTKAYLDIFDNPRVKWVAFLSATPYNEKFGDSFATMLWMANWNRAKYPIEGEDRLDADFVTLMEACYEALKEFGKDPINYSILKTSQQRTKYEKSVSVLATYLLTHGGNNRKCMYECYSDVVPDLYPEWKFDTLLVTPLDTGALRNKYLEEIGKTNNQMYKRFEASEVGVRKGADEGWKLKLKDTWSAEVCDVNNAKTLMQAHCNDLSPEMYAIIDAIRSEDKYRTIVFTRYVLQTFWMLCALRALGRKDLKVVAISGESVDECQQNYIQDIIGEYDFGSEKDNYDKGARKADALRLYNTNSTEDGWNVVLIGQMDAAGTGTDFKATSRMYWLEPPLNAINFYQQMGRGVRFESHKLVEEYKTGRFEQGNMVKMYILVVKTPRKQWEKIRKLVENVARMQQFIETINPQCVAGSLADRNPGSGVFQLNLNGLHTFLSQVVRNLRQLIHAG